MTDVLWKAFELLVSFLECCVVIHFICAFLNHDFKTTKGIIIYFIGVIIDFLCVNILNLITVYEGVLGIIYILIYYLYAIVFLKGSKIKKMFASVTAIIVLVGVGAGVSGFISVLFNRELSILYGKKIVERIYSIILIQTMLVIVYDIILKFSVASLKKKEWGLIISILSISFLAVALIHAVLINIENAFMHSDMLIISEIGIIVLVIVSFYMTYSLSKSNSEAEQLRMIRQQEEYRISYAKNIKEQYEEIRRMRHDMKQNLAVISALYREHKYNEANEYAGRVSDNLEKIEMVVDVHNDFINAILNSKLSIASEYGIRVICVSSSNIDGINDIDLCSLLGNILDNAIEAAKHCQNGCIEVSIRSEENAVLVIIANTISESVLDKNKELKSTKKNFSCHGYGVKTIRSIAEKYKGTASFYEEGDMFYCQVMMYKQ